MDDILTTFDIVFNDASAVYREGDEISGEVIVDLRKDIVVEKLLLEFFGTAVVQWVKSSRLNIGRDSRASGPGYDEEKCLNQKQEVPLQSTYNNNTKEYMVSTGRHSYPFSIQLPYHIPSTFTGDHGGIKYTARASLIRPVQSKQTTSKEFTIVSIVDLNTLPQALEPIQCQKGQQRSLTCCFGGSIEAVWRLDRMGYIPGEVIGINGEIHNNSRLKVKKSKAMLIQHVRYLDGWGESLHERKQVALVSKGEVLPGHIGFWREEMEVPPLPPTGLKGCNLMDMWYTLKLKVLPIGIAEKIETTTDIIIATVHPRVERSGPSPLSAFSLFSTPAPPLSHHTMSGSATPRANNVALDLNYFI